MLISTEMMISNMLFEETYKEGLGDPLLIVINLDGFTLYFI